MGRPKCASMRLIAKGSDYTWRDSHGLNVATLRDEFGNTYKRINYGFSGLPVGGVRSSESLDPGAILTDLLIFEPPIAAAELLTLTLPTGHMGTDGPDLRFEIPVSNISESEGE